MKSDFGYSVPVRRVRTVKSATRNDIGDLPDESLIEDILKDDPPRRKKMTKSSDHNNSAALLIVLLSLILCAIITGFVWWVVSENSYTFNPISDIQEFIRGFIH